MRSGMLFGAAAPLVFALGGCGGSDSPADTAPKQIGEIAMPTLASFDLAAVDSAAGRYYLAAAATNSIDVVNIATGAPMGQLAAGAFAGTHSTGFDPSHSGPNGIVPIPGTHLIYAGDVNSVKVVDASTGTLSASIVVSGSGLRSDEGCYDPDDGVVMFASPEESPPFATFISTKTQAVIAKYVFSSDTSGLEQCVYDAGSKSFLINNDGTTAHPDGEVDVIATASVLSGVPAVSKTYPLAGCGPAGLALGPNRDMLVGCNPAPGKPQVTLVLDRGNGTVLATIPFGGEDAVAYDAVTNRYFLAAFFHQTNNVSAGPATASPSLGVVDAGTRALIAQLPTGVFAHSVAVDGSTHKVFVAHFAGAASSPFAVPGVTVFSTD